MRELRKRKKPSTIFKLENIIVCSFQDTPAVNGTGCLIEAHLLNYSGNLYGKTVTLAFLNFIFIRQKTPSSSA
ncbi:hypothetical protein GJU40_18675 [Bacillus lacus]|uniref:riboflavin kinase n=1 Tax=Metabacillus lacus TaxID=1983721 RepID=A0A7X2LZ11_9BACI|nr:hypothetical protein [Metabacillus lacus]